MCIFSTDDYKTFFASKNATTASGLRLVSRIFSNFRFYQRWRPPPMRRCANKSQAAIGKYDDLRTMVKKMETKVTRFSDLAKTILQGTLKGK